MELDLETVHREAKSRFDRRLAALVGVAAIVAALLASLEMYSGKREERAFTLASRLSNQISTGTAVTGLRGSFEASALTQAAVLGLESTTRAIAAGLDDEVAAAFAVADERTSQRLLAMAQAFGTELSAASGLDPTTRRVLGADHADLMAAVEEQGRQVDLADSYGNRENAAIFGLSLLAIAAVLLGLAGIVGESRQGTRILVLATGMLSLSILWGATALLR